MALGEPLEVATRHTVEFLASHLVAGDSLLEVGCGNGEVAAELARRGFAVIAVDADPNCVAQAQSQGIDAIQAEWPIYDEAGLAASSAIAFTRSLHHIHLLREAVARAAALTRPGGKVLLEDFAHDEADPRMLEWFAGILRSAVDASQIAAPSGGLCAALLGSEDLAAAWRVYHTHDHRLHTFGSMRDAIAAYCTLQAQETVPYLYRYLLPLLPRTTAAADFAGVVFRDEQRRSANGEFTPVGRRIVATH